MDRIRPMITSTNKMDGPGHGVSFFSVRAALPTIQQMAESDRNVLLCFVTGHGVAFVPHFRFSF